MTNPTPPQLHVNLAIPETDDYQGGDVQIPVLSFTVPKLAPNATPNVAAPRQSPVRSNSPRLVPTLDDSWLSIVNDVACSSNRTAGIECLAQQLAARFPETRVRCALGTTRMQRCYDHQLGWLRPPSALHADLQSRWDDDQYEQRFDSDEGNGVDERIAYDQRGVQVFFDQPNGSGRCLLWLDGVKMEQVQESEIIPLLPVLRNLLWRRPRFAVPSFCSQLGLRAKWSLAAAVTIVAAIALWPTSYPVDCTARVEPVQQRLVSAPFEAMLLETHARPGDEVTRGQPLLILDGRPLRLELESTKSEEQKLAKEHDVALATGRIAEAQQLALQRQRLTRRLELITDRLHQLTVTSPVDGIVVSGDLDRLIGGTLELGQTLMEVAPMDSMAILVEIPEHEIGYVKNDAMVRVRIGSSGGPSLRSQLSDLYPAAEIRDARNVFVGRILVDNPEMQLRPGMQGKATTYGPLRPLAWPWVRGSWERLLWWSGY